MNDFFKSDYKFEKVVFSGKMNPIDVKFTTYPMFYFIKSSPIKSQNTTKS